jgi:hypothetical protein
LKARPYPTLSETYFRGHAARLWLDVIAPGVVLSRWWRRGPPKGSCCVRVDECHAGAIGRKGGGKLGGTWRSNVASPETLNYQPPRPTRDRHPQPRQGHGENFSRRWSHPYSGASARSMSRLAAMGSVPGLRVCPDALWDCWGAISRPGRLNTNNTCGTTASIAARIKGILPNTRRPRARCRACVPKLALGSSWWQRWNR